jgi:hypothetical protein
MRSENRWMVAGAGDIREDKLPSGLRFPFIVVDGLHPDMVVVKNCTSVNSGLHIFILCSLLLYLSKCDFLKKAVQKFLKSC